MRNMQVWITADSWVEKRGYMGAGLMLPANQDELQDAMQRARVQGDGTYCLEYVDGWPGFLTGILELDTEHRLEEVNLLADRLSRMSSEQMDTFEGAIALRVEEKSSEPFTLKELINFTYNLNCYELYPGVTNDTDLGEVCIEGEMMEFLEHLPEEDLKLLDPQKVGKEFRRSEQGTFTGKGYVCKNGEPFQEMYDEVRYPEIPGMRKGPVSLRLVSLANQQEEGVWLDLPATEQMMQKALETLHERSFDDCVIAENEGSALPFSLAGDEEIGKLNVLAERVQAFPDSRTLAKYKAVIEMELCNDLDQALDIAANLDCYDFDPEMDSPARYAEYLLQTAGFDTEDPAFRQFDFKGFGERRLKEIGYSLTSYGAISRNELPFRQEYSKPQQGMTMQ